jgi:hypothetical protein
MKLAPVIDSDVPIPLDRPESLEEREVIYQSAQTAIAMSEMDGLPLPRDVRDEARAQQLFTEGRSPTHKELQRPALVLKLEAMLSRYDELLIEDADTIRRYVTGKLIEEAEAERSSAAHRIKALELLGKISTVALFADRTEITVEHRGTEELEAILRSKLDTIIEGELIPLEDKSHDRSAHM